MAADHIATPATAYELASYFAGQCRLRCWGKSPEPVNVSALAKRIAAWRKNGTSDEDIRSAMDTFVGRVAAGPKRTAPLWKDFCSQINELVTQAATRGPSGNAGEARHDREARPR